MKKTAKILVLLLTLSLVLVAFSMFASAQNAPFTVRLSSDTDVYDTPFVPIGGQGAPHSHNSLYDAWQKYSGADSTGDFTITMQKDHVEEAWTASSGNGYLRWGRSFNAVINLGGHTLTLKSPKSANGNFDTFFDLVSANSSLTIKNGTLRLEDFHHALVWFDNQNQSLTLENVTIVAGEGFAASNFLIESGERNILNILNVDVNIINSTIDMSGTSGGILKFINGENVHFNIKSSTLRTDGGRVLWDSRGSDSRAWLIRATANITDSLIECIGSGYTFESDYAESGENASEFPVWTLNNTVVKGKIWFGRANFVLNGGYYDFTAEGRQTNYNIVSTVTLGAYTEGNSKYPFPTFKNDPRSMGGINFTNINDGVLVTTEGNLVWVPRVELTIGETTTYYTSFKDAWANASGDFTIKINEDVDEAAWQRTENFGHIGWDNKANATVDLGGNTLTIRSPKNANGDFDTFFDLVNANTSLTIKNGYLLLEDFYHALVWFDNQNQSFTLENVTVVAGDNFASQRFVVESGERNILNILNVDVNIINSTIDMSGTSGGVFKFINGENVHFNIESSTLRTDGGKVLWDGRGTDSRAWLIRPTANIKDSLIECIGNGYTFESDLAEHNENSDEYPVWTLTNTVVKGKIWLGRASFVLNGGYYDCSFEGNQERFGISSYTTLGTCDADENGYPFPIFKSNPSDIQLIKFTNLASGTFKGTSLGFIWLPTTDDALVAVVGNTLYFDINSALAAAASENKSAELVADVPGLTRVTAAVTVNTNGYDFYPLSESYKAVRSEQAPNVITFALADESDRLNIYFYNSLEDYNNDKATGNANALLFYKNNVGNIAEGDYPLFAPYATNGFTFDSATDTVYSAIWNGSKTDNTIVYIPTTNAVDALYVVIDTTTGDYLAHGTTNDDFTAAMTCVKTNTTLRLLGDVAVTGVNQKLVDYNCPGLVFIFDLNGHKVRFADGLGNGDMWQIRSESTVTFTSSKPGAEIHNYSTAGTLTDSFGVGGKMIYSTAKLTFNYNGSNISYYGNVLLSLNTAGCTANINGGHFNVFNANDSATIYTLENGTINISDATFYHTDGANTGNNNYRAPKEFLCIAKNVSVNITNSTIIGGARSGNKVAFLRTVNNAALGGTQTVTLNGCNVSGYAVLNSASTYEGTEYVLLGNCHFDLIPEGCTATEVDAFSHFAVKANYWDSETNTIVVATLNPTYTYASGSDVVTLTFMWGTNVFATRKAVIGDTVSVKGTTSNGIYYADISGIAENVTSDAVINVSVSDLKVYVKDMCYNLSLDNDMSINLAIPAEYLDDIASIKIDDVALSGKSVTIDGKDYYYVTFEGINAVSTTDKIKFVIFGKDESALPQELELSVSGYATGLLESSRLSEQELARSILNYALWAEKYFGATSPDTAAITELESALASANITAPSLLDSFGHSIDTTDLGTTNLAGATLNFNNSSPAFIIVLDNGAPETQVTISYINQSGNTVTRDFTLTAASPKAIIDNMKVYDFDNLLTITVDGTNYTYNLQTYLNWFAKYGETAEEQENNKKFANAIWNYVQAASAYKTIADSNVVTYSDFGADTTGLADSYSAILAAHKYANEHGLGVRADAGATYYIGLVPDTYINGLYADRQIPVKTDTDWGNAKFIIDDSGMYDAATLDKYRHYDIFRAAPTKESYTLDLSTVTIDPSKFIPGSTNIGITFPHTVMLNVENENKKVYKRTNGQSSNMQDLIVVDKDGNIIDKTALTFDYGEVTKITVYSASDTPITLKGGTFYSRANRVPTNVYGGYVGVYRGIRVERSNTTIEGVQHYMIDEPTEEKSSMPYNGFYFARYANNVTFKDCVVTGHKVYQNAVNGSWNGSYDVSATSANGVSWLNCKQKHLDSNGNPVDQDITYNGYWGVIGTNFSRNLTLDNCRFSRFDAHSGVYNVTVTNSEIGYQTLNMVGNGDAYFENTTVHGGSFISLRADYGATWNGNITIKNCAIRVGYNHVTAPVISAGWQNWDFGYACHLPNVSIEGFKVYYYDGVEATNMERCVFYGIKSAVDKDTVNIFAEGKIAEGDGYMDNINPLQLPSEVSVKAAATDNWVLFHNVDAFFNSAEQAEINKINFIVNTAE